MKGIISLLIAVFVIVQAQSYGGLSPYGTIRVDAVKNTAGGLNSGTLDSERNTNGDKAKHVTSVNESASTVHIRQSKLGVTGTESFEKADVDGKVEVDFFGEDSQTNAIAAKPRMRYGYMGIHEKMLDTNWVFGQADDIVAPLNPTTFEDGKLNSSGNTGYRRPQAQVNREFFNMLKLELSASKPWDRREMGGRFDYAGRASIDTKDMLGSFNAALGAGYLSGRDRHTDANNANPKIINNLVEVKAMDLALTAWGFKAKGEYYWGAGASDYRGLGDYDTANLSSLKEKGYWFDLTYSREKYSVTLGHGQAKLDPISTYYFTRGNEIVTMNQTCWANFTYNLSNEFSVGLEYAKLTSTWSVPYAGRSNERYDLMFSYKL